VNSGIRLRSSSEAKGGGDMHDCVLMKKIKMIHLQRYPPNSAALLTFFRKTGTSSFLIGIFFAFIVGFVAFRGGNNGLVTLSRIAVFERAESPLSLKHLFFPVSLNPS